MSDTPAQCAAQSTTLGATSEAPHPPSHAKNYLLYVGKSKLNKYDEVSNAGLVLL
jgi:hypothetical protein